MTSSSNDETVQLIKNGAAIVVIIIATFIFSFVVGKISPFAMDWHHTYYPATRAFIRGKTPYYQGSLLENPIWVCVLLAPFAIFPEALGRGLLVLASVLGYYAALHNAGLPKKWILLVFLSPQILYGVNMGTIDAFVMAAPVFHPILGFMLALSKPQIGIGFAVFLLVEWMREKKYREMLLALILSGGGILISLWLGMSFSGRLISVPWNTSLFPYSIPLGFAMLIFAIVKRRKWEALIASPMLSPYLTFHSWVILFVVNNPYYLIFVSILSWAIYLAWHFANL